MNHQNHQGQNGPGTAVVESWRETLFGEDGTLKDKLIGAAA
jgi:hypothetical protein